MHALSRRSAVAVLAVALALTGCAAKSKTGSNDLLNFKDKTQHALGAATATPSAGRTMAPRTTAPAPAITAAAPAPPRQAPGAPAPRRTQAAAPQRTQAAPAFVISINSDTSAAGSQFTPSVARVYAGQVITWTNKDQVARSVVADKGAFSSGSIAPGASYIYTAKTPGQFSYHDGTRPYAVASLEVLKR